MVSSQGLSDSRRDYRPIQLDRLHDDIVWKGPYGELDHEARHSEQLVLEEDLVDHLLRTPENHRSPR